MVDMYKVQNMYSTKDVQSDLRELKLSWEAMAAAAENR